MVENLRDRGVIRRAEDLGIDKRDATRNLLAARSMRDLVRASRRPVQPAEALPQLVRRRPDMSDIAPGLEALHFTFAGARRAGAFAPVLVGVVGSGNLEVLIEPAAGADCTSTSRPSARGFGPIWEAVLRDFHQRHPLAGVRMSINDMGATPAVVSLRLDQAVSESLRAAQAMNPSYAECSARERIARLFDPGSFHEWLPPAQRVTSPHLAQLGVPCASTTASPSAARA